jgi:tRNA/tmRNA/rRNA uracil-C5-methylase (TrmA/RlmC/RlmD family)
MGAGWGRRGSVTTPTTGPVVGEVLEVVVEKGVYRGLGLARHEGRVVFVPRGLPGDRFRVRVTKAARGFLHVAPLARLEGGPSRRAPPCSVSHTCGGCAYQDYDYPAQLSLKEGVLRESLGRAGAPYDGEIPVAPSPEEGWRTRASLHVAHGPEGLRVGLHEEGSHRLVEFDLCLQLSRPMNAAVQALKRALGARPSLVSRLDTLDLAESPDGSERVAAVSGDLRAEDAPILAAAAAEVADLTGLGFWRERRGNRDFLQVRGDPHVHATVLGRRFRVHIASFFQANRFLVEDLARAVVETVPAGSRVLDLYCGVGLFSLPLAARGNEVMGAEISESAVRDASANGRDVPSARFFRTDVLEALSRWPRQGAEHVILDPPRAGAGREVVEAVASRRPEGVVYVSCDPPTLGRDLADFARVGFRPESLRAFDMFPNTFHLETLVRLVPA